MKNIFTETYDIISKKLKETPKPEPKTTEAAAPTPKGETAGAVSPDYLKKAIIKGNSQFMSVAGVATPYTDLAFEDYNRVVKPLRQKLKDIEAKQRGLSEHRQEASKSGNRALVDVINNKQLDLKALEKEARKQLNRASMDYQPDIGLTHLARELDAANDTNKGLQLVMQIQGQLEDILLLVDRTAVCYRGSLSEPVILSKVRENVCGLLRDFNGGGVTGLRQIDKAKTEAQFEAALAAYKKQIAQKEEAERFTFAM